MWIPNKLTELLGLNAENVRQLQADLSTIRAERDLLKIQLATAQNNFEWVRVRVNALELERAGLMEKAYNIKLPTPELARVAPKETSIENFSFEDIGNEMAKQLGLPVYD